MLIFKTGFEVFATLRKEVLAQIRPAVFTRQKSRTTINNVENCSTEKYGSLRREWLIDRLQERIALKLPGTVSFVEENLQISGLHQLGSARDEPSKLLSGGTQEASKAHTCGERTTTTGKQFGRTTSAMLTGIRRQKRLVNYNVRRHGMSSVEPSSAFRQPIFSLWPTGRKPALNVDIGTKVRTFCTSTAFNRGLPWNQDENEELKRMWLAQRSLHEMASTLGRTYQAVGKQLSKLGWKRTHAERIRRHFLKLAPSSLDEQPPRLRTDRRERPPNSSRTKHAVWTQDRDAILRTGYQEGKSDQAIATDLFKQAGTQVTQHQVRLRRGTLGYMTLFTPSKELAAEILKLHDSGLVYGEIFAKIRSEPKYQSETLPLKNQATIRSFLQRRGATLLRQQHSWTVADGLKLRELRSIGTPYSDIAKTFGVSVRACQIHYYRLTKGVVRSTKDGKQFYHTYLNENGDIIDSHNRAWTKEDEREALKMYYDGLPYSEIGKQLSRSESAVRRKVTLEKLATARSVRQEALESNESRAT